MSNHARKLNVRVYICLPNLGIIAGERELELGQINLFWHQFIVFGVG